MKTWFLPPDFTFTPDGTLPLGAVIAHPSRPTDILASPRTNPAIPLPEVQTLLETNHSYSNEASRSGGFNIFAKFVEFASGSVEYEASRRNVLQYGNVDHEVRSLVPPFSKEFLESITAIDNVKEHIESGMFGKRPVYLISGLRITNEPFSVTRETGSSKHVGVSASGPTGPVPVEAGGGVSGGAEKTKADSYETAPGIVFAYRLHVIRPRGSGSSQSEMFSHRKAFMTGGEDSEPMEVVEVTLEVVGEDIEEEAQFDQHDLGNDACCLRAVV